MIPLQEAPAAAAAAEALVVEIPPIPDPATLTAGPAPREVIYQDFQNTDELYDSKITFSSIARRAVYLVYYVHM